MSIYIDSKISRELQDRLSTDLLLLSCLIFFFFSFFLFFVMLSRKRKNYLKPKKFFFSITLPPIYGASSMLASQHFDMLITSNYVALEFNDQQVCHRITMT